MNRRVRTYCRYPRASAAAFGAEATSRFLREMFFTFETWAERWHWTVRHARAVLSAPLSPVRAARRAQLADAEDFTGDCRRVQCPTLIVTGDPRLDRVVPAAQTLRYQELIDGARTARLRRTGHLGTVTRPAAFAEIVREFLETTETCAMEGPRNRAAGGGRR